MCRVETGWGTKVWMGGQHYYTYQTAGVLGYELDSSGAGVCVGEEGSCVLIT